MSEDNPRAGWIDAIPGNWMWATFPDVLNDATDSKRKLPTNQYRRSGTYPVIDQGEGYINGFTDDADLVSVAKIPCIVWGDHTRRAKFLDVRFAQGADGVKVLEPTNAVDPSFIFKAVAFAELPNKGYSRHFKFLRAKEFPLPPLEEQWRIVRKLDTLSARSATARTHLTAIEKLVERYKSGFIKEVFARLAEGRPQSTLSRACLSVTDGDHQAPPKAEMGVPFITISAMNSGEIDLNKATRYVPESYFNELKSERRPQVGDILYSVTGSIGIPAPVLSPDPFVFQRHIAILRPDPSQMRSEYLRFVLLSPQISDQAVNCATGIAQLTIPLRGLRAFSFPLPSLDEQNEIVRRIETAFAKIDRLAAEAEKALKLTDRLDQRILAKAFAGELVPQDPNDEPAAVLLERLRAERGAKPKVRRGRRASAVV